MKRMSTARMAGVVLLSAAVTMAGALSATAGQPLDAVNSTSAVSADVLAAMQRDLGLTAEQATAQLAAQGRAADTAQVLRGSLGQAFGGAWFDAASGKLVATVTDASLVGAVRAAGAQAKVVARSEATLAATKAALDGVADASDMPSALTGWYVDATTNSVVVRVNRTAADASAAADYLSSVVGDTAAITMVEVAEAPQSLYNLIGGDAWYGANFRCSVGFSTVDGGGGKHMVTAGHCTASGGAAYGSNRVFLGNMGGSRFPGNDYGKVDVTSGQWSLTPWVSNYAGGVHVVRGSAEAPVGGGVCRSGSTTGLHCGSIQAKNQTVRYSQGAVYGLTMTNVCAEPGDSGGAWISGDQAQGVTSGGSGNCRSGGTTFFQPVNPALSAYGLRLVTG